MIDTLKTKLRLTTAIVLPSIMLCAGNMTVSAQDASVDEDDTLEEIVIVGRGRQETIQDVPLSVTAFSGTQIVDANITNTEDFLNLTPGLTFAKTQGPGSGFLSIRGLTQVRNSEPPVATVVDGVLQV